MKQSQHASEVLQLIRSLEQEVRLGYWYPIELDWTDAVLTTRELVAEHSLGMVLRAMDFSHVAVAIETAADAFLTFDKDPHKPAKAGGIDLLKLS